MTDSGFASGQVEKEFRALNSGSSTDRFRELELRVDRLEARIEELASRLAWILELSP